MYNKVVMILNVSDYSLIADHLDKLKIPGISIGKIQGYGNYFNNYSEDGLCDSLKIEVYATSDEAKKIADEFSLLAKKVTPGGGIVAIEPVSNLFKNT